MGGAAAILSVPLLGVGIGVTAIASNLGQISDKAKGVGAHLRKIQDAYGSGVYTRKDGALSFEPEAVITELDLQGTVVDVDGGGWWMELWRRSSLCEWKNCLGAVGQLV